MSRASQYMEALSHNTRVGLRLFDPEAEAIYYCEGKGIFQVMTGDKAPRNRQKLNPRIAQVVEGVYSTARKAKDHTFNIHNGWGVSKFVVDRFDQFGFGSIEIETPRGKGSIMILDLLAAIETGEAETRWEKQAGYEPQYILTPKLLGLPEEIPNAGTEANT